jgi:hypothetical protein
MSDQAAAPPVDSTPALGQWERIADTFIAPSKTFADIRRNASWWMPWIIISLLVTAYAFTVQQKVGWTQVYENMLHQNPKAMQRLQQAPPDRVAAATAISIKATQYSFYAQPILLLLIGLITSAVLWGTLNFGFGGRAKFGEVYAVWFYASLPMALVAILAIITLYSGLDPGTFNIKNPIGTNLGYYLSSDSPQWLIALLSSIDVLKIWTAVLLTIGCAKVAQIKKSSAAIAVFGWWILIILIGTTFAAFTG